MSWRAYSLKCKIWLRYAAAGECIRVAPGWRVRIQRKMAVLCIDPDQHEFILMDPDKAKHLFRQTNAINYRDDVFRRVELKSSTALATELSGDLNSITYFLPYPGSSIKKMPKMTWNALFKKV